MTMHDALKFIDAFHGMMVRSVSKSGPWCWPTREQATANLRRNRHAFPHDKDPSNSFRRQLKIARGRHWLTEGPCQSHCHAQHITLTGAGQEALRLMNEQGCGPRCAEHRDTKLHFERKVA